MALLLIYEEFQNAKNRKNNTMYFNDVVNCQIERWFYVEWRNSSKGHLNTSDCWKLYPQKKWDLLLSHEIDRDYPAIIIVKNSKQVSGNKHYPPLHHEPYALKPEGFKMIPTDKWRDAITLLYHMQETLAHQIIIKVSPNQGTPYVSSWILWAQLLLALPSVPVNNSHSMLSSSEFYKWNHSSLYWQNFRCRS